MPNEVIDRDMGFEALARELGSLGQPGVYVGILQDKGGEYDEEGNITLAGYAAVNEFGTDQAGPNHDIVVPERSFLRSTVDEHLADYQDELAKATGDAIDAIIASPAAGAGKAALERGLGRLGLKATRDVQNKIRDLREPPNADSTLAAKYPGDNPLIETGRMRQSISFLVDMEGAKKKADEGAA